MKKPETVDEYISTFPKEIQDILQQLRQIIKQAAPEAMEIISYGMPGYKSASRALVYYAANAKHLGFYPAGTSTVEVFKLAGYKTTKGSVHFPYTQPLPEKLIIEMVKFRVLENEEKNNGKSNPQI